MRLMIHESDSAWFLTKSPWPCSSSTAIGSSSSGPFHRPSAKFSKMFSKTWRDQCLALAILLSDTHGFLIHCSLNGVQAEHKNAELTMQFHTQVKCKFVGEKNSKRFLVSKIYSPNLRSSRCLGTLRELPNHSWDQPSASLALGWDSGW